MSGINKYIKTLILYMIKGKRIKYSKVVQRLKAKCKLLLSVIGLKIPGLYICSPLENPGMGA